MIASPLRVTAIVPVHDGEAFVGACVAALRSSVGDFALDVILVDDASTDASVSVAQRLVASTSNVELLRLPRNIGFAGAVNFAAWRALSKAPAPDVLVFVNQDCFVEPGAIAALAGALDDPAVGVAGARLLDADGTTLQHAGALVEANGLTSHLGRGSTDPLAFREDRDVEYVCGALVALLAATWRRFGPFDAGYAPAYFEEVDFCSKVRRAGLRVRYVAASEARHVEASTSRRGSALFLRRYHRSRMRFVVMSLVHDVRATRWLAAEVAWLAGLRRWSDVAPVLAAYLQLPRLVLERMRRKTVARAVPLRAAVEREA